jgi:uncharacterized damage-inducible protein DinB
MSAAILDELVRHKWYANAAYLAAISENEAARQDQELRKLFLHIIVANRFWVFLTLGREFDREKESRMPDSIEALIDIYTETDALEMEWLSRCNDTELARKLVTPHFPGKSFTVAQAFLQICMHGQGHRAQSAIRLRTLGGTPPPMDFILWAKDRPAPDWSFASWPRR